MNLMKEKMNSNELYPAQNPTSTSPLVGRGNRLSLANGRGIFNLTLPLKCLHPILNSAKMSYKSSAKTSTNFPLKRPINPLKCPALLKLHLIRSDIKG